MSINTIGRHVGRGLIVIFAIFAVSIGCSARALAASGDDVTAQSGFSWSSNTIYSSYTSSTWLNITNGATISITSRLNCAGGATTYKITLYYHGAGGPEGHGTRTYGCNASVTNRWINQPGGSYHFFLSAAGAGSSVAKHGEGNVKW